MKTYVGYVDGLDVQIKPEKYHACITADAPSTPEYIEVTGKDPSTKLALGLAAVKRCRVEVWYEDDGNKTVRRIRLLDRQPTPSTAAAVPIDFAALNPTSYPKIEIKGVTFTGAGGAPLRVIAKASVNRLYFPWKGLAIVLPEVERMVAIEVGTDASQLSIVGLDETGGISTSAIVGHSQMLSFNNVKEVALIGGANEGFVVKMFVEAKSNGGHRSHSNMAPEPVRAHPAKRRRRK